MAEPFDLGESYLSFRTSDLEALTRDLLSDEILSKAMAAALDEMERQMIVNFTKNQTQWKPLAETTIQQRLRQGYGPSPILQRSETLLKNAANGREIEFRNGEIRGDVFPNDDAKAPYSDIPLGDYLEALDKARPFYDLDDDQMEKVYSVFEDSLFDLMGAE